MRVGEKLTREKRIKKPPPWYSSWWHFYTHRCRPRTAFGTWRLFSHWSLRNSDSDRSLQSVLWVWFVLEMAGLINSKRKCSPGIWCRRVPYIAGTAVSSTEKGSIFTVSNCIRSRACSRPTTKKKKHMSPSIVDSGECGTGTIICRWLSAFKT